MNKTAKNILRTAGMITLGACIAQIVAYRIRKHGMHFAVCTKCGHEFNKACCKSHTLGCICPACRHSAAEENS